MSRKANTLLIGCGGIGTIAALNLEIGSRAAVTAVLRSNYTVIVENGFDIKSVDHGIVAGFKPTMIRNTIPDVTVERLEQFEYVVITTKNIPDIPPSLVDTVRPAVTPGFTVIVLMQNGLNIEKPFLAAFPTNIVLSAVSFIGSHQTQPGQILHEYPDEIYIGAFHNPTLSQEDQHRAAHEFCDVYKAGGKTKAEFAPDATVSRWRKLLYNACLNPICAITDLDTGRVRLADDLVDTLVRPAMEEIRAAAQACVGNDSKEVLSANLVDVMINMDPLTMYNPPSMQVDIQNGRFTEFENIVGEPLREGTARGVAMPVLTTLYALLKAVQWRTMERKGMVQIPAKFDHTTHR